MANKTRKLKTKGKASSKDWVVAIPSYKRAEILKDKTLAVLHSYKIEPSRIYIFVADEDEKKIYEETLPKGQYNKIIVAKKGLDNARNIINGYFPVGQKIVEADDDIRGFIEFDATKRRHEKPLESLKKIIDRGFAEAEKHGARLWGVYPSANGFFMKDSVSTDLKHIVGSFWGQVNPGKQVQIHLQSKEDYERTLQFWKIDGVVVRLNFVSPQTAYYKTPGGLQLERTKEKIEDEVKYLQKHYPDYFVINPHRKSGFVEIRLRDPAAAAAKTRKLTKHT
jgi:hypothetical protein